MAQDRSTGTQTLERAILLLKALAERSATGWRLTDLAAHCGLRNATAHRLLASLARHRLARRRAADRRYAPGPMLFELGLAFPALAAFQGACRAALARLARRPGGAAFIYLRSGEDFVCIARAGDAPVRGLSVEVGTRRPLAVSAPGVAILLALPPHERERVIEANMRQVRRYGEVRVRSVERVLRRSRRAGVALNLGDIVPGLWSFGVPLFTAGGTPFAALGLTGHAEHYSRKQIREIVQQLREEARRIERDCAELIRRIAD
jgi:DNA-binding IclR family transcriptional regulator